MAVRSNHYETQRYSSDFAALLFEVKYSAQSKWKNNAASFKDVLCTYYRSS